MKFTIPHYIALIVSLFKRVPKHLKFRAVTFSKDWSWSPVFKRHFKWFKLWSCWVRGAIAYSTRVNFLPSTTLLGAKLDVEILFWPDPCECGCCENSNADGNLTPWSVYRNFWMMRLWSCFLADEMFLVSHARGGHALCTAKHQHSPSYGRRNCRVDAEAKKMSTRGVPSALPIGGAIYSNGHRLQARREECSHACRLLTLHGGAVRFFLERYATWWVAVAAGTCQCYQWC